MYQLLYRTNCYHPILILVKRYRGSLYIYYDDIKLGRTEFCFVLQIISKIKFGNGINEVFFNYFHKNDFQNKKTKGLNKPYLFLFEREHT